jgi:hypothetical protein
MTMPTIVGKLLQWKESLCPLFFFGVGGGVFLGFCFLWVLGVVFFWDGSFITSLLVWATLCPHCSGLYTLGGLSRHVKSVHPHVNLVSQPNQTILFLQVSSPYVFFPGLIPLDSWGWFTVQSSSILGLFESHFVCFHFFHRIPQAIQEEVKKAFCLPFDPCLKHDEWINKVLFPLIVPLVFMLYSKRLFRSMRGFYLPQEVCGKWLVFFLGGVFMCLMCVSFSPFMGRFFNHSFSPMSNFRESWWV